MSTQDLILSNQVGGQDPLQSIFYGLSQVSERERYEASIELKAYMTAIYSMMSSEDVTMVHNIVNSKVFKLMHSASTSERLGGLAAIDKLIELVVEETAEKRKERLYRYSGYLNDNLPIADVSIMIRAAHVFGRVVAAGLGQQFMDFQAPRGLELLGSVKQDAELSRFAGVLILRELARNAPADQYTPYAKRILDKLWAALKEPGRTIVRETAAELLTATLDVLALSDSSEDNLLEAVVSQAYSATSSISVESIHGGLLAFRALMLHAVEFLQPKYAAITNRILSLKDHRDSMIRTTVIKIIPTLAGYSPAQFAKNSLSDCMLYLLPQLKKDRDQNSAFLAIGMVAEAVGSDMRSYIESVMISIRETLRSHGNQKKSLANVHESVFQCLSRMTAAVGPCLSKHMHELLPDMFNTGLSEGLVVCMTEITINIPPLLPIVQDRILDSISVILSGAMYQRVSDKSSQNSSIARDFFAGVQDSASIILALRTVAAFDFLTIPLVDFAHRSCLPYLDDDSDTVRHSAATACCKALMDHEKRRGEHEIPKTILSAVIDKLLTVAISDQDAGIRRAILWQLQPRHMVYASDSEPSKLDQFLAEPENLRLLFVASNDEIFEIRELAYKNIGRLADRYPALLMSSLRKAVMQLLTELEFTSDLAIKETSSSLLASLIEATGTMIASYASTIVRVLVLKARDPSPVLSSNVMRCLSRLIQINMAEDISQSYDTMFKIGLEALQDRISEARRASALDLLTNIASNRTSLSNYYLEYPELMTILSSVLQADKTLSPQVVKLIGVLGALDPYKNTALLLSGEPTDIEGVPIPEQPLEYSSQEEAFQTAAMTALLILLRTSSQHAQFRRAMDALMKIFQLQGTRCISFLPQVMAIFDVFIRSCAASVRQVYVEQLQCLVNIVKGHMRSQIGLLIPLIQDLWTIDMSLQPILVTLIGSLAKVLAMDFKASLPNLLPSLLASFDSDFSERAQRTQLAVLKTFADVGHFLEEYIHLILPILIRAFDRNDSPQAIRKAAIQTVSQLARKINLAEHASRIIQPLARILALNLQDLRNCVMDALCYIAFYLGQGYLVFVSTIQKYMLKFRIQHSRYEQLVSNLLNGDTMPSILNGLDQYVDNLKILRIKIDFDYYRLPEDQEQPLFDIPKLSTNMKHIKDAHMLRTLDWEDWMHRLSLELLRQSPSHTLRSCREVAQDSSALARALFNSAFLSCWPELSEQYQEEFKSSISVVLADPRVSEDVILTLLNLSEHMDRNDLNLNLSNNLLCENASRLATLPKLLYYHEKAFENDPTEHLIDELIKVNTSLQQTDAALGALHCSESGLLLDRRTTRSEDWFLKLGKWQDALTAFSSHEPSELQTSDVVVGKMLCLQALGDWEQLSCLLEVHWANAEGPIKRKLAPIGAMAAWNLAQWNLMDGYISALPAGSQDYSFYKSIFSVHKMDLKSAAHHISECRTSLRSEIATRLQDNYDRAYPAIVRAQMLSELEETISYRLYRNSPIKQRLQERVWRQRLNACKPDTEVWQNMLQVRAAVLPIEQSVSMQIKFFDLCTYNERSFAAERTFSSMIRLHEQNCALPPFIEYCRLNHHWTFKSNAKPQKSEILRDLLKFTENITSDYQRFKRNSGFTASSENIDDGFLHTEKDYFHLLSRCHHKIGQWKMELTTNWKDIHSEDILETFRVASEYDTSWYEGCHIWALSNYDVLTHLESVNGVSAIQLVPYIVAAVQGFFHSIKVSKGSSLQDTLRILTIWFKYGHINQVTIALDTGFSSVSIDTWLDVIPQIIARINARYESVRRMLQQLLGDVGLQHPHALIYPLCVAVKSQSSSRRLAAENLLVKMREHNASLIEQALTFGNELIRTAILWIELWYEGLEEASRLWFGDRNSSAMFECLQPLHKLIESGANTLEENRFYELYYPALSNALKYCQRYKIYAQDSDMQSAWELYYAVFRKIEKVLPTTLKLDLRTVSPALRSMRNLELTIPGSYSSGKPLTRICGIGPEVTILTSKQRPRKIHLFADTGSRIHFLLKGHEDLRLDERCMQLFGLVNTLLVGNTECFKRSLHIKPYPVIPLSSNSGLLEWVENTDTLHTLIKDYRDRQKILLNIEQRLMSELSPDLDRLCRLQKMEVFLYAQKHTQGTDLCRVLWLKSKDAETWLLRRTEYTRSLAVMSMVGYIIGLGDRHPSNILLERSSSTAVHIDFGECWEATQNRTKFPETNIPFRLTRMMTKAMEVTGVQGTFKISSIHTMKVLRYHRESLLALLEAFLHDPLLAWRLDAKTSLQQKLNIGGKESEVSEKNSGEESTKLLNAKAYAVLTRCDKKLKGTEFGAKGQLSVDEQVSTLIDQATSAENLSALFVGYCSFW